jgi:hypothetical protein
VIFTIKGATNSAIGIANMKATKNERGHILNRFALKHSPIPPQNKYTLKETRADEIVEDVARAIRAPLNSILPMTCNIFATR